MAVPREHRIAEAPLGFEGTAPCSVGSVGCGASGRRGLMVEQFEAREACAHAAAAMSMMVDIKAHVNYG